MRVIEMGKIPEKEVICDSCNSTLAYTDADVNYTAEEIFGEWHDNTKIKCPVCGNTIILTVDGLPFNAEELNDSSGTDSETESVRP